MTNYGFTHVNVVRNVAPVGFFSSRACEFLNGKNFAKAKIPHSGNFALIENNVLYGTYITTLYYLVENCQYGELAQEIICDRLVVGILDKALSK